MISLHLTVNNIKIHCCYVTSLGGQNFDKKNRNLMQEILRSKLNFSIYTVTIIFKILFFRKEQTASQMPYPHYIMLFYRKVRKIHAFLDFIGWISSKRIVIIDSFLYQNDLPRTMSLVLLFYNMLQVVENEAMMIDLGN